MNNGINPRSLANLRPHWTKGISGNQGNVRGPVFGPRMRYYAERSYVEIVALAASPAADLLPLKDVIALTTLLKAARDIKDGDQARKDVIERLDGKSADVE